MNQSLIYRRKIWHKKDVCTLYNHGKWENKFDGKVVYTHSRKLDAKTKDRKLAIQNRNSH